MESSRHWQARDRVWAGERVGRLNLALRPRERALHFAFKNVESRFGGEYERGCSLARSCVTCEV